MFIEIDRNEDQRGGGVFVAVSSDLISEEEFELETYFEIIWMTICLAGCKLLHICAYYRPNVNDENSLEQFEISLNRVKPDQYIFIGGDFNFPGWDWHNELLKPNCQNVSLHEQFRNILDDFGLIQYKLYINQQEEITLWT